MTKLKNKIFKVDSLPKEKKKSITIIGFLLICIVISIFILFGYFIYKDIIPYLNAVNINKIVGKKININDCNTKDYIIINKDKIFSMEITNNNCEQKYYEGTLIIKNNEIIFNKKIKGYIDNNYNIVINNYLFESEDKKIEKNK